MFKPVRAPKEGRSPPGLLYAGPPPGGRRFSQRQISIALIVAVCFLMGYFVLSSEGGDISSSRTTVPGSRPGSGGLGGAIIGDAKEYPPADATVPEVHAESSEKTKYRTSADQFSDDKPKDYDFKPAKDPLEKVYQKPASESSLGDVKKTKQEVDDEDGSSSKPVNPAGWKPAAKEKPGKSDINAAAPVREKWGDRPQFEKALAKVIDMLPDEVHMRELIRKVDESGKERMREMGLRTRAYRKYFDAWEALHLTTDAEGATYIRDDVVQYLRSHQQNLDGAEFSEESIGGMNTAQTIRSYEAYRTFMVKFSNLLFPWTKPYFSDHMSLHASIKKGGRGIVLTAGDDQAPYLLTTIWSFRQLGCTLPIEVMYLGDRDLGEDYRAELEALPGVITRDIAQMTNDEGWRLAGWAAKPFAILLSSFREVSFIDTDSLFFRNPETLFDDPGYKETGALFFKDRMIMPENKKRWLQQVLPKPIPKLAKQSRMWTGESGHMQESGVVVVDKWKHFIAMLLITRFNGPDRDGNKEKGITGVYDMMYGDKETFWLGFLLAGDESYAFHEGDAGILGEFDTDQKPELKKRDDPADAAEVKRSSIPGVDNSESPIDPAAEAPLGAESITTAASSHASVESPLPSPLVDFDEDEAPTNYTMCAPQLLHMGLDGKPLWFNGWLLHNKFAEKSKKRFAHFKSYLVEPRELRDPTPWQLGTSNMCCLTTDADKKHDFDEREMEILNMIMKRAEQMGMGDQR